MTLFGPSKTDRHSGGRSGSQTTPAQQQPVQYTTTEDGYLQSQSMYTVASGTYSTDLVQAETEQSVTRRTAILGLTDRSRARWQSCTNLSKLAVSQTVERAHVRREELERQVRECIANGVDVYGTLLRKVDGMITSMDEGIFTKERAELVLAYSIEEKDVKEGSKKTKKKTVRHSTNSYFSKVYLYSNSILPPDLPPLTLYPPAYPLLRIAARYSRDVYVKPRGQERHSYVSADLRQNTKAMVIKSLPLDDMNMIVFAIRGTQSFRDWAVNMKTAPTSPSGFLDDPTNHCHAGFLAVARNMVEPVAARLRSLLDENPDRASCSLFFTGHSAGGAVANLLYCHMLSTTVQSELTHLRGFFNATHCVTFGSPPVSLRPLQPRIPTTSIFFAFINEGDPVARAEKAYVRSLLDLYISPTKEISLEAWRQARNGTASALPRAWNAPPATLSRAGLLVLLRGGQPGSQDPLMEDPLASSASTVSTEAGVDARVVTDEQVREVIFGDPLMHMMDLYATRIEQLAMNA